MSARVVCGEGGDGGGGGQQPPRGHHGPGAAAAAAAAAQAAAAAFTIMQPHTLYLENIPADLDSDLATQLIQLQLRELSSLDYDLLLRLDDRLQPRTLGAAQLAAFLTEVVTTEHGSSSSSSSSASGRPVCSICKEEYAVGQVRKFLPCNHGFHVECIDRWLSQSSVTCPLDGLAIGIGMSS